MIFLLKTSTRQLVARSGASTKSPEKRVADRQHCPRSSPKLPVAGLERRVQPVERSAAAAPGVPTPVSYLVLYLRHVLHQDKMLGLHVS
jgi:hypothetical protein